MKEVKQAVIYREKEALQPLKSLTSLKQVVSKVF